MNASENLPVVAEQAGTDWGTALIGVMGVIIGAGITTIFAWLKARDDQVQIVRENVTRLAHTADLYLSLVTDIANSSKAGRMQVQPPERLEDQRREIRDRYKAVRDAGYAVAACPDGRVSQKALDILAAIKEFANGHYGLSGGGVRDWPARAPADQELLVLLYMVKPKSRERLWRFRSARKAKGELKSGGYIDAAVRRP